MLAGNGGHWSKYLDVGILSKERVVGVNGEPLGLSEVLYPSQKKYCNSCKVNGLMHVPFASEKYCRLFITGVAVV